MGKLISKRVKLLATFSFFVSSVLLISSCQDYTISDNEVIVKRSFETNFKETFGEIDKNQSWDLTKTMPRTAKYTDISYAGTRATDAGEEYTSATTAQLSSLILERPGTGGPDGNHTGWYNVPLSTLTWMQQHLEEGENNTNEGGPFQLISPKNKFAIIPIYQGQAGLTWDLHLVDTESKIDYNLWTKSQGLNYKRRANDNWQVLDQSFNSGHTVNSNGHPVHSIIGQPIIIDNEQLAGEFFLYLDITGVGNTGDTYARLHSAQKSTEGMMLTLNCPIPEDLDDFTGVSDSEVMIIGCEDANLSGSDWDMNDVVFLIVGYPEIPEPVEYFHKRYLCEDLGNTYDFDFNDIVVDVNQTSYYTIYIEDGKIKRKEDLDKRIQTATITHLCGTLPFQVTVGDYTFPVVTDPTNVAQTLAELSAEGVTRASGWDPMVTKTITGWDMENNNINIKVAQNPADAIILTKEWGVEVIREDESKHIYNIGFPDLGEVPLIIAVDQTVQWMEEYEHIPESWWKDGSIFKSEPSTGD